MDIINKCLPAKFRWGSPCNKGHGEQEGKNLRYASNYVCVACNRDRNTSQAVKLSSVDRFWLKVDKTNECWNWTGCKNRKGYGQLTANSIKVPAHRFAWELENGKIPEGMLVCHVCDNPSCVRVAHLFLGLPSDNTKDMMSKGRHKTRALKGENCGTSKLTSSQVLEIREKYRTGNYTQTQLADEYGMTQVGINSIISRRNWKHLL